MRRVITPSDAQAIGRASITARATVQGGPPLEANTTSVVQIPVTAAATTVPDDYWSKLVKYIPAEIVAGYVFLEGILKSAVGVSPIAGWLVFVALWIITPLYTWRTTKFPGLNIAYTQIVIATVSFPVWVFALGGPFAGLGWYNSVYGSILLVLYTFVPPIILGKK